MTITKITVANSSLLKADNTINALGYMRQNSNTFTNLTMYASRKTECQLKLTRNLS